MKRILAFLLSMLLLAGTANAALFESKTNDAQPMVLYGKYNNTIVPVKVAADGSVGGGSSQWTTSGSSIYYNTGNVGINSGTPQQALDVGGNILTNGYIQSTGTGDAYFVGQYVGIGTSAQVYSQLGVDPPTGVTGISLGHTYSINNYTGITDSMIVEGTVGVGTYAPSGLLEVGVQKFNVLSSGNVGIGSPNPGNTFVINAAAAHAGQAACMTTNGAIGYCTSVVGAGGGCTCTAL